MRVRERSPDLDVATAFDKDVWRSGAPGSDLGERYRALCERLFGIEGGAP
jgi:hypothetical protein